MKQHLAIGLRACAFVFVATVLLSAGFPAQFPSVNAESDTRHTPYPSTMRPDQLCLTWSEDPRTTQSIQWRTSPRVKKGVVKYCEKAATGTGCVEKAAERSRIEDSAIAEDPMNARFTARLEGLTPGTTYAYRVGNEKGKGWSEWSEFTTAPESPKSFSFIYLGDAQAGLDAWGRLLRKAYGRRPDAAFCVMAGDSVNRGDNRDQWDMLFHYAEGVFDRRPVVPALGNHDYAKEFDAQYYVDLLDLPKNGPDTIPVERAYSLRYGNALFLVLDSNQPHEAQRGWIEDQLRTTDATWKFAVYHHPAYSSAPRRDNPTIRERWGDLFDKYHLDMAFQGHDHGYLRTKPMRAGKPVDSPAEGTVYVVSVSGTKYYNIKKRDYAAATFARVSTYQVIDIEAGTVDKLTYQAYDAKGKVRDKLVIEKRTR